MEENIVNIEGTDIPHIIMQNNINNHISFAKSFICKENGENLGWIVLGRGNIPQVTIRNDIAVHHFIQTYNTYRNELPSFQILSIFERNDNEIIYNIFDKTCGNLDLGTFLWGIANNANERYLYNKLSFIHICDSLYAYQFTI